MPPKAKYTKEEVAGVVLEMTRESGFAAVTSRGIGQRLGTSTSPVFHLFKNKRELELEVRKLAMREFENYVGDALDYTPAFKQFGMKMVEFAVREPKLFQILFMREQEESTTFENMIAGLGDTARLCIRVIQRDYDLTEEEAEILFGQTWLHTFSLCALLANRVCCFSPEQISRMLSMEFQGELSLIKSGHYRDIAVQLQ